MINLFAPDGHNIPFGRSMTYRFATSCFFAGLAFDNFEVCHELVGGSDQEHSDGAAAAGTLHMGSSQGVVTKEYPVVHAKRNCLQS